MKSLYLTGKKPTTVPALDQGGVKELIAAGRDYFSSGRGTAYVGRSTEQLLTGLSSWSPAVRKRSARALAEGGEDVLPTLLKMLESPNRHTRYGACEAIGYLGPRADAAGDRLRALLKHPDPWMRSLACAALPALGPDQRRASLTDLLVVTARNAPDDPRGMTQRAACAALFAPYPGSRGPQSLIAESLEGVDRALLYPAIESALKNQDGAARRSLVNLYGKLTDRDLVVLLPAIVEAVDQLAPSNEMFGDDIRLAGLDLLSRLHIREAMPLCISVIEPDRWGSGRRIPRCLEYLTRYGSGAREVLPQLRDLRRTLVGDDPRREQNEHVKNLDRTIATIEAGTTSPTVISVKEFRSR